MIELEEYKNFIKEAFAGVSTRINIGTATDWHEPYPIVQLHFGQSYLSCQTIFKYNAIARIVIFIPVRFGNGFYEIEDWTDRRHIDDPETFHKAVYDFIHDLREYEKREKISKMKMEARKYAC